MLFGVDWPPTCLLCTAFCDNPPCDSESVCRSRPWRGPLVSRPTYAPICQRAARHYRIRLQRMDRDRPLLGGFVFHFQTLVAVARDNGHCGPRRDAAKRVAENFGASTSSIRGRLVRRLVGL